MEYKIGQNAGRVWKQLEETKEPVSLSRLKKDLTGVPEAELHYALGWLAREDKVDIFKEKRTTFIKLKSV